MTKKHVLMIDNYDSFTWNLYQYLSESELCSKVDVYRNDKIDVDTIENKIKPDLILISPGPGHPNTDSGISRDVVDHFKGKLPIFGVCMGQQCIFDVFGGDVSYAGEIVHGKTTSINHNGKGVFKDIPQGVAVTRYHSLAGTLKSLPDCLEVTARTDTAPEVIMGVRHKKYTIEGVQFHPESILTESGRLMIRNLLSVTGGTWDESEQERAKEDKEGAVEKGAGAGSGAGSGVGEVFGKDHPSHPNHPVHPHNPKANILEIIYEKRRNDYKTIEQLPGKSFKDLEACVPLAPPVENFYRRLRNAKLEHKSTPVLAEFKRASPSKGVINRDANVVVQASIYASNNAAAISVLTEPNWFLGSLDDLTWARKAVDFIQATASDFQRPAILRKEFIFCKYQILEARLAGADSVLLIVKMLDKDILQELYEYSMSLRMIPLVEVNNKQELDIAIQLTYKDHTKDPLVIGVNNRNLTTFDVDLATTGSLVHDAKHSGRKGDVLILALSGITSVEQVKKFKYEDHVDGFLVGESLMRAEENGNAGQFLHDMCKA